MKQHVFKIFGGILIVCGLIFFFWFDSLREFRTLLTFSNTAQAQYGTSITLIILALKQPLGYIALILIGVLCVYFDKQRLLESNSDGIIKFIFISIFGIILTVIPCFLAPPPSMWCGVFAVVLVSLLTPVYILLFLIIVYKLEDRSLFYTTLVLMLFVMVFSVFVAKTHAVKFVSDCSRVKSVWEKQYCYNNFATLEKNFSYCHYIKTDKALTNNIDFSEIKDNCFREVARKTKDQAVCHNINSAEIKEKCLVQTSN